ncbi:hypothetical protein P6P90_17425 [Ectobacillus antri]|uniref:Transposase n=1 Tax=Ectobacillus antri TaxID=2486280 RepID=A0ABT6HAW4_9BACI|nr:hypothetical protein [Ectobacillus antri]MDG4658634.1 hypothetical protein [Ectobacillus antri]MDG5755666.1 hypothetical protein [Ectobacillus antri]
MPQQKLKIVPVILHGENETTSVTHSSAGPSSYPACTIKTGHIEISFFNGTDERIIQTVMKGLKLL